MRICSSGQGFSRRSLSAKGGPHPEPRVGSGRVSQRSGASGTPRHAGAGLGNTNCSSIHCVSIAWSAPSSRQQQSAITSSHTMATSTSSGSAPSSRFARNVTTLRNGRRAARLPPRYFPGWVASGPAPSGLQSRTVESLGRFKSCAKPSKTAPIPAALRPRRELSELLRSEAENCCDNRGYVSGLSLGGLPKRHPSLLNN